MELVLYIQGRRQQCAFSLHASAAFSSASDLFAHGHYHPGNSSSASSSANSSANSNRSTVAVYAHVLPAMVVVNSNHDSSSSSMTSNSSSSNTNSSFAIVVCDITPLSSSSSSNRLWSHLRPIALPIFPGQWTTIPPTPSALQAAATLLLRRVELSNTATTTAAMAAMKTKTATAARRFGRRVSATSLLPSRVTTTTTAAAARTTTTATATAAAARTATTATATATTANEAVPSADVGGKAASPDNLFPSELDEESRELFLPGNPARSTSGVSSPEPGAATSPGSEGEKSREAGEEQPERVSEEGQGTKERDGMEEEDDDAEEEEDDENEEDVSAARRNEAEGSSSGSLAGGGEAELMMGEAGPAEESARATIPGVASLVNDPDEYGGEEEELIRFFTFPVLASEHTRSPQSLEDKYGVITYHRRTVERYAPFWTDIVRNFHRRRRSIPWKNVPNFVRPLLWNKAIGNELRITPELYRIIQERRKYNQALINAIHNHSLPDIPRPDSFGRQRSRDLIAIDLRRTFNIEDPTLLENMKELLETLVEHRPDIGYTQGMTFVALVFVCHFDLQTAFILMANVITKPFLRTFYTLRNENMSPYIVIMNQLLRSRLPLVHSYFVSNEIELPSFLVEWILTLFTKVLPLHIALCLWDGVFIQGESFLYSAILGILECAQNEILSHDGDFVRKLLTNMEMMIPVAADANKLLRAVDGQKIPDSDFESIISTYQLRFNM